MCGQISAFFTIEMIYLWLSFGVLPFWFVLIFFPQSRISGLLVTSIFPFIVLGTVYIYLLYYFFIDGSIYLSKVSFLKKYNSFVVKNKTKLFKLSQYPSVDIDEIIDLKIAKLFL